MPRSYRARHAAPRGSRLRLFRRGVVATAALAVCVTGAVGVVGTSHADAATTTATVGRNPIGSTPAFTATATGLSITGWAADPDQPLSNLHVGAVVDGRTVAATTTSIALPAVTSKYHVGSTPGYTLALPLDSGNHIVCVSLQNLGGGLSLIKRCVATPLGRVLTAKQVARRSPVGAITTVVATSTSVRLVGWSSDPDWVSRRSTITMYVDGAVVAVRNTSAYPGTRPAKAGANSRFDITVPASNATHIVCARTTNIGPGKNTYLGCTAVDPRAAASTTAAATAAPVTPVLNQRVVAMAKKQIGRPYVWAAAGPKSFDCSGLVMWSYKKYGFLTPRVSQDQIKAARLIPAARAVPGDLVFYHDNTGDVYHVGIYLSPGLSVAAIDTDEGVNYQRIWDTTATYGSFTHT